MDISVVIVSWNVRDLLDQCLRSLRTADSQYRQEIIVIDNNSADQSVVMVRESHPDVTLIANDRNVGFAAACNQGIAAATGQVILLLNPDVQVNPGSVAATYDFLASHDRIGMAGCQIAHADGTTQPSVRRFPDVCSQALILLKVHNLTMAVPCLRRYFWHGFDYQQTQRVDQVMGAFLMVKRRVIESVGKLDEGFFLWFEEVDWCQCAADRGWETWYFAGAAVSHAKGRSFSQLSPLRKQLILNASMLRYFTKHRPWPEQLIITLLQPVSLLLAGLVQIFSLPKRNRDL